MVEQGDPTLLDYCHTVEGNYSGESLQGNDIGMDMREVGMAFILLVNPSLFEALLRPYNAPCMEY